MASDPEQGRCVPSCCRHAIAENANSGDLSKSESCASCAAGCLPHPATYERSAFQRWHDATQHRLRNELHALPEPMSPDRKDQHQHPQWPSERQAHQDWLTPNAHHRRNSEYTREDTPTRRDGTRLRARKTNTRQCPWHHTPYPGGR